FESVHAPIRIKAFEEGPRAPGTQRCPRKSLVPDRVQKDVTGSQKAWFSQPETGSSAEQARGLGVLEKLCPGGQGRCPIRQVVMNQRHQRLTAPVPSFSCRTSG